MIAILLSTYNGEKYLSEQIESILGQSVQDFTLYVRDDGSSDRTVDIVLNYHNKYPDRIVVVDDPIKHRGANYSFLWLLKVIECDYYMFCDQDDVWLPNKIEVSIKALKKAECNNPDLPILVHTDMKIVDHNLSILSDSLYKSMKIHPGIIDHSFNFMGVCSCGPGCSMLFNKKAKDVSLDCQDLDNVPMHDWWVAINTVKNGKIVYIATPTMLYRQHQTNTVGASNVNTGSLINKITHIKKTFAPYDGEMKWLKNVGYGSKAKFYFYKFLYNIIRLL